MPSKPKPKAPGTVDKLIACLECGVSITYDVEAADNERDGPDPRRLAFTRYHAEVKGHRSYVVDFA